MTVKNNNHNIKRHRGSSPPFQRADQGLYEWEIGFKSMYQPTDESPYIQMLEEQEIQEEDSDEQASDARQRKSLRNGQDSIGDSGFRQSRDDEDRWQDEGGESG